jgi:acyl carrier protein
MIIEEKIKDLIAEQLQVNPGKVTPEARLIDDLNADTLDLIELVFALEEDLGIEIPDKEADKFITVKDIIDYCISQKAKLG